MKNTEIMNKVSGTINKVGFQLRKHSPEILIVAGVVGTVASAVMACKATTKISEILDETKDTVDTIHGTMERAETEGTVEYSLEDSKKDLAIVYAQTGVKLAKLYAPSIVLGTLSITAILASNDILRKRNVALAAAYATVDQGFKEYRNRVVERFGKDLDRELRYNIKAKEIEETITDEKGKEKKVKKTVNVLDPNVCSVYGKFFDESCDAWEKDPEYNLVFLRAQEKYANDLLKSRGHLFLNEVYDMLGIKRTKAGQIVGWVYDPVNSKGDNYVDFGIYECGNERFINGVENVVLLDFNVDGNVWELM